MNQVYTTLEYNKIIDKLVAHAYSAEAKKRCHELEQMTEREAIEEAQTYMKDALTRILKNGSVSLSGINDVNGSLQRLRLGASLSVIELRIRSLLETAKRMKTFSKGKSEDAYSPLKRMLVHEQLNKLMAQESTRSYLHDAVVTIPGDRFCLPVKAEYKSQVQSMVHDQSSTGSTVFIEPLLVVNLNNELKALLIEEQEEIEAILAELSDRTAEHSGYWWNWILFLRRQNWQKIMMA